MQSITTKEFRALFNGTKEFAVIDPREEGVFTRGHLLAASNLPLNRFEIMIPDAVPNKGTLIVLCDDMGGEAERAIGVLQNLGYRRVFVLYGGLGAWALSGGAIFTGINVPGKAFGEFIAETMKTPMMSASSLHHRLTSGLATRILDARTPREHADYSIPGAIGCPGGEIVFRGAGTGIDTDESTPVVVHCAGRTRGIIGAQSLIDSGVSAPVYTLENGTPAWSFESFSFNSGDDNFLPPPNPDCLRKTRANVARLAERHSVQIVGRDAIHATANPTHTSYLIDVRTAGEYRTGHLQGFRNIPGGQLIQNIERHLCTRNARIVLADTDGVRAMMAAVWLKRMGWLKIYTVMFDPTARDAITIPDDTCSQISSKYLIGVAETKVLMRSKSVAIFDIRRSVDYVRGHISRSALFSRVHMEGVLAQRPGLKSVVLVAIDFALARLTIEDFERCGLDVRVLHGGLEAWIAAGYALSTGPESLASPMNDCHWDPDDFEDPVIRERENRAYLAWEIALTDKLINDPAAPYANTSLPLSEPEPKL